VEVPLAVKSNTPLMSPPRITPLAKVVVANLPLMVMLSLEAFPNTTSPFIVVVAVTVKSSETSKLFVIETSPNNVVVPDTHKPPDKIEFPEIKSWVILVVAWVEVEAIFKVEPIVCEPFTCKFPPMYFAPVVVELPVKYESPATDNK